MEYERGFHGWLVFFFVTTCFGALARMYILVQTSRTLRYVVGNGEMLLIAAVAAQLLIDAALLVALVFGLKLFSDQDARTPTYWSAFFLAVIPLELLNFAFISYQSTYYNDVTFSSALWNCLRGGGLRGMLLSLVWAVYWMRSNRVRLTYGKNGFDRQPSLPIASSRQII